MKPTVIQIRKHARVYIVEDNEERLKWFFAKLPSALIWYEKDPKLAVEQLSWLMPESMDCIFLDFDLGPGNVKHSTINAIPVVDFLNSKLTSRRAQRNIVIHSQNAPGAFWMNTMLPGAARLPFGEFDIQEVP
jgi:hypothetical protein